MKKDIAQMMVITTVFAGVLMQPALALAFWPFDAGQVKGVQTENSSGFMGMVQRMFKPAITLPPSVMMQRDDAPRGASGISTSDRIGATIPSTVLGIPNPKARLDQAVKEGKLTQAQATEILAQLDAIKTKQEELMKMQTALAEWMKANNLSTALFSAPRPMPPKGTGYYGRPTGVSGQMPQYYKRMPPQAGGGMDAQGGQTEPGSAPSYQ